MALVKFIQATESKINSAAVTNGTFYVSTDTGKLFVDVSGKRVRIGTDTDTKYTLSKSGNNITLSGTDGKTFTVTDANTTYGNATSSASGLMSNADKTKLDSLTKIIVDSALSSTSTNPIQNKAVNTALGNKADKSHTHDDRYYTEAEINSKLAGKSDTSHTHNYAGASSAGGSANSAVKLATPRNISLSGGVTSSARAFDGSGPIDIPVSTIKEAYLQWGGKDLSGYVSPVDCAASNLHSANRFAFANAAGINIEYSIDNGKTFLPYTTNNVEKVNLVSGIGQRFFLGGKTNKDENFTKSQLRITLSGYKMGVYTKLRKLLINVSTQGAKQFFVKEERSKNQAPENFIEEKRHSLIGWSGWNSITIDGDWTSFGANPANSPGNIHSIRLTFYFEGGDSVPSEKIAAFVENIYCIGEISWIAPSEMALSGHLYKTDAYQNATFPGKITAAGGFVGNATSASLATKIKDSQDGHGILVSSTKKTLVKAPFFPAFRDINQLEAISPENLRNSIDAAPISHTHNASDINAGTLSTDRLPAIPDAKITGISASKITGTIAAANLPSYVDDVLEYANKTDFPGTGEKGKIYVDTTTNLTYRWSGSAYVEISPSLALGTTSASAFRGDYGNTAYQHAVAKGSAFANDLYKITTNAQGHVTGATKVVKADITSLGIPAQDTTYSAFGGATTSAIGKAGLVPAPSAGAVNRVLSADGTWKALPTYSLSSFGVTAKANEINFLSGVTSNIQTQLNGKAASNHTHTIGQITNLQTELNKKCSSDIISISSTEPTSSECKLWIKI